MARPRKLWSESTGRYGATVRIWEPRLGAPLRWDYRENGQRCREEVAPTMRVRASYKDAVDPVLERKAIDALERKAASLTLEPLRQANQPEQLTIGRAYALYFDPRRKALPRSRTGLTHQKGSRAFWETELGKDTLWDSIAPADVWGALMRLEEAGQVPTAEKRFNNLRTLYRWLRDKMGYDALRDPMRTLDKKKLVAGHIPSRPRYTDEELEKMLSLAPKYGARFNLFALMMGDGGARPIQVREAMRSGLNCTLEPPPPKGFAPEGHIMLGLVKGQEPMLVAFTKRVRAAMDTALRTYLADWEAKYQAGELEDYPLFPGDRGGDHGPRPLLMEPISDTALRETWAKLQEDAGIPARERLALYGSRRNWSDDIFENEGLDTLASAGGWSNRDTPEKIYISKARYAHIERARQHRESKTSDIPQKATRRRKVDK